VPPSPDRLLASRPRLSPAHVVARVAVAVLVVGLIGVLASRVDFAHDLRRLHARVSSGGPEGNYHALVDRFAAVAAARHGSLANVASAGSTENIRRLAGASPASPRCDFAFALAQDGSEWAPGVQLLGRLPKAESVLFLGKNADAIGAFADLHGYRIGVGPTGSGSDRLARQLFALPEFGALGVTLSNHGVDEELAMALAGDLDLAVVVIDADAPLVDDWVAGRGLQIASFSATEAVARRLPHLKSGRVREGNYDAVRTIPRRDKSVMKVETLLVGNGCAGRAETLDMLGVVASALPDFVRHNKDTENTSGLALSPAAADFFAHDGPELADQYLPWLVDVMPPANWAYVVMGVSLLFNAMGFAHRFRLWRVDAARVKLEGELARVFPASTTLGDIERMTPGGELVAPTALATIDAVVRDLEALAARSRRYSLSFLVPMGQEMAYRYQEGVIYETLTVLRHFKRRIGA
jgi:TRAP-type uncharacterized transport system substrate-binding protein